MKNTGKQDEIREAYANAQRVERIPAAKSEEAEDVQAKVIYIAPYVRVSTDGSEQLASYELQYQYYKEYVSSHPEWQLVDIYADEGISGTSVKKRAEFLRMLEDCKAGKIDMIITKNISRFARNVVDCVETVRMLKNLPKPVAVYFEDMNINTLTQTGELLMIVMAAVAQGESETKSESVKWGFRKRFAKGLPKMADLYGYDRDKRDLTINETEANVVRLMYHLADDEMSIPMICDILNASGVSSPKGGHWTYSTVRNILSNEKYCGDVVMQKTVTIDVFSHRSVRNDERLDKFYLPDHHEAIVSRELWQRVNDTLNGVPVPLPPMEEVVESSATLPGVLGDFYVVKSKRSIDHEYFG